MSGGGRGFARFPRCDQGRAAPRHKYRWDSTARSLASARQWLKLTTDGLIRQKNRAAPETMSVVDAGSVATRKSGHSKLNGPEPFAGMRRAGRLAAEALDL